MGQKEKHYKTKEIELLNECLRLYGKIQKREIKYLEKKIKQNYKKQKKEIEYLEHRKKDIEKNGKIEFKNLSAAGPLQNGALLISLRIACLDNSAVTTCTATADATAVYALVNKDGNFLSSINKVEVKGAVSVSGEFIYKDNHETIETLILNPPTVLQDYSDGQSLILLSISYSNIVVSNYNLKHHSITGKFDRVYFEI